MTSKTATAMAEFGPRAAAGAALRRSPGRPSSWRRFRDWRACLTTAQRRVLVSAWISSVSLAALLVIGLHVAARSLTFH